MIIVSSVVMSYCHSIKMTLNEMKNSIYFSQQILNKLCNDREEEITKLEKHYEYSLKSIKSREFYIKVSKSTERVLKLIDFDIKKEEVYLKILTKKLKAYMETLKEKLKELNS